MFHFSVELFDLCYCHRNFKPGLISHHSTVCSSQFKMFVLVFLSEWHFFGLRFYWLTTEIYLLFTFQVLIYDLPDGLWIFKHLFKLFRPTVSSTVYSWNVYIFWRIIRFNVLLFITDSLLLFTYRNFGEVESLVWYRQIIFLTL